MGTFAHHVLTKVKSFLYLLGTVKLKFVNLCAFC